MKENALRGAHLAVALVLSLFVSASAEAAIPQIEHDALVTLYQTTHGAQWGRNGGWLGPAGTECTWYGVTCDDAQTAVIGLDLGFNNVAGPIPAELKNLQKLQSLSLAANPLTGSIPIELTQITSLQSLRLGEFYGNPLGGTIPKELARLTNLQRLDLSGNALTGPIPPELATLPNLQELVLYINQLSGPIPPALLQSPSLTRFEAYYNKLTGALPAQLSPNLTYLDLSTNQLSGTIPPSLGSLSKLQSLVLNDNQFTGSIPKELGQLALLEDLQLQSNQLTGALPPELGALTHLIRLNAGANHLSGGLPDMFGQLTNLQTLALYDTDLSGPVPATLFSLPAMRDLYLSFGDAAVGRLSGRLSDFTRLTTLRTLDLAGDFTGPIPPEIARLTLLEELTLSSCPLGGTIPPDIGGLTMLGRLYLDNTGIGGPIPDAFGNLSSLAVFVARGNHITALPATLGNLTLLQDLVLSSNEISGPLPLSLGHLPKLEDLVLDSNKLTGPIPPEIFQQQALAAIDLSDNQITGPIPPVAPMKALQTLKLAGNQLTGAIPADFDGLKSVTILDFSFNHLTGPIPASVAALPALARLTLDENDLSGAIPDFSTTAIDNLTLSRNHFSGSIPHSVGRLVNLSYAAFGQNKLSGQVPAEITNLTALPDTYLGLDDNALFNDNPSIADFLRRKAGDWESRQTVAPKNVAISAVRANSLVLTWTPIAYTSYPGGYAIYAASSEAGPFALLVTTPDKGTTTFTLDGLIPNTTYFVRVGSVTWANNQNDNDVYSDLSPVLSAVTTTGAPAPASVVVLTYPQGLYQDAGASGGADLYVLTNVGDVSTTVTVGQDGDFFTQTPSTFTLAGGSAQRVDITGLAKPAGAYNGFVTLSGSGVPPGLRIPIRLLSSTPPSGTVNAVASINRIDVAATVDISALSGSVTFTNTGSGTLSGIVVSDVSWIIPPTSLVTIPSAGSTVVDFAIDRQKRPDAGALSGAAVGTLSLVYATGTGAKSANRALDNPPPVAVSIVTVVDTVKPPTSSANFAALNPGEVPLFLPGVGHLQGSVGLFLSDLSLINAYGTGSLNDVRMYYTPASGFSPLTSVTTVGAIQPTQSVALADVVSSVYNDQQQGTLQIRSANWRSLSINANIFNVTNVRGTFGSSIPVFRADRAVAPGGSIWLAGIRKTDQSHTNLLLQETSGNEARADISFYDAAGNLVAAPAAGTSVTVPPFQLYRDLNVVPAGAVAARITNRSDSTGRLVAYATPIDDLSGDFWTVADWNQVYASSLSEPLVVPVAGSLRGANNNFFRTDVAISNRGGAANAVALDFYSAGATPASRRIALAAGETRVLEDIIGTLYPELPGRVGSLIVTPSSDATVTSRTFATQDGVPGTFGTGVPVIPFSLALHAGQSRLIAGVEVASAKTIAAKRPATFRTNVGLEEIGGGRSTVRVTVTYADVGQLVYGLRLVSKDFALEPHQFLLANVTNLIAESNPNVGDLRNVQLAIKVLDGDGAIIAFTSSVDNGSADQIFRLE